MNKTTIALIHWIWGEAKLADFMREVTKGESVPPHGEIFDHGDEQLAAWISDFVFPEDRSRGSLALGKVIQYNSDARARDLYEALTEGRKDPAGRLAWLDEMEVDLIRDALLGYEGDSDIYVHSARTGFAPGNRYRVHDRFTVFEPGWTCSPGDWGLSEPDRQVCPVPIGTQCECAVEQQ